MQWEDVAVVSKWTHLCHADSLHPSPSIAHHLPQVMPLLSKIFLSGLLLVSCLSAPQHTIWKRERRDQDEIRVLFLKFHKDIPH